MTSTHQEQTGEFVETRWMDEPVSAFVPHPLPDASELELNAADFDLMERANRALGRLDSITTLLPDPDLFLYLYVRKEAVLSSQIEGTQSSLSDLLLFEDQESPGAPISDVREVSNYVRAMYAGLDRLREGDAVSIKLLCELHAELLQQTRGSDKAPGQLRDRLVWIGGTWPGNAAFVPPPPEFIAEALAALMTTLDQSNIPVLIKAALAHVQFETIHPFTDGNGRIGRLLITFILCAEGVLTDPLLYLSLFFKTHRTEYYNRLQRVRTHGDWEGWLGFFLEGVRETSNQAVETARSILQLFADDRKKIATETGRAAGSALRVHEAMQRRPLATISTLAEAVSIANRTVQTALERMEVLGIVSEITGGQRYRVYRYDRYMDILIQGTEPL